MIEFEMFLCSNVLANDGTRSVNRAKGYNVEIPVQIDELSIVWVP